MRYATADAGTYVSSLRALVFGIRGLLYYAGLLAIATSCANRKPDPAIFSLKIDRHIYSFPYKDVLDEGRPPESNFVSIDYDQGYKIVYSEYVSWLNRNVRRLSAMTPSNVRAERPFVAFRKVDGIAISCTTTLNINNCGTVVLVDGIKWSVVFAPTKIPDAAVIVSQAIRYINNHRRA